MLWLGRQNRWGPGYWIGLPWSAFKVHVRETGEHLEELRRLSAGDQDGVGADGVWRSPVDVEAGFGRPDLKDLASLPFGGDGDDPLEEFR